MSRQSKGPKKSPEQRLAEKRDRFLKLAAPRVNKALHALVNIGRMGNLSGYSYSEAEAEAIIAALTAAVADCKRKFFAEAAVAQGFTLPV